MSLVRYETYYYFLPSVTHLFSPSMVSFRKQFLILMKYDFSILYFIDSAFGVVSKAYCLTWGYTLSVLHLGMWSISVSLWMRWDDQLLQHDSLGRASFLQGIAFLSPTNIPIFQVEMEVWGLLGGVSWKPSHMSPSWVSRGLSHPLWPPDKSGPSFLLWWGCLLRAPPGLGTSGAAPLSCRHISVLPPGPTVPGSSWPCLQAAGPSTCFPKPASANLEPGLTPPGGRAVTRPPARPPAQPRSPLLGPHHSRNTLWRPGPWPGVLNVLPHQGVGGGCGSGPSPALPALPFSRALPSCREASCNLGHLHCFQSLSQYLHRRLIHR